MGMSGDWGMKKHPKWVGCSKDEQSQENKNELSLLEIFRDGLYLLGNFEDIIR